MMTTPELETAEQLVESLCAHVVGRYPDTGIYVDTPPMAALIEARDAAVARRVLDEVVELGLQIMSDAPGKPDSLDQIRSCFTVALREVRARYAEPSGRKEE